MILIRLDQNFYKKKREVSIILKSITKYDKRGKPSQKLFFFFFWNFWEGRWIKKIFLKYLCILTRLLFSELYLCLVQIGYWFGLSYYVLDAKISKYLKQNAFFTKKHFPVNRTTPHFNFQKLTYSPGSVWSDLLRDISEINLRSIVRKETVK